MARGRKAMPGHAQVEKAVPNNQDLSVHQGGHLAATWKQLVERQHTKACHWGEASSKALGMQI